MKIRYGKGTTVYGTGVEICLTGDEVAHAIDTYLLAHHIIVSGPRTVTVNGNLCKTGEVYVDPSGFVITPKQKKMEGSHGRRESSKWFRWGKDHRTELLAQTDINNVYWH